MKNILDKAGKFAAAAVITAGAVLLIWAGKEAAEGAAASAMSCLTVLIPSLYAFTVISKLLISTDTYRFPGLLFNGLSRTFFHMSGDAFGIMLISQLAGFPIGASLIEQMYRQGDISKDKAEGLLIFCIAPGPAFIMAVCRNAAPQCPGAWKAVFTAVVGANLIAALVTAPFRRKPEKSAAKSSLHIKADGHSFGSAVRSGAEAMAMICGSVIFAGAAMGALGKTGLMGLLTSAAARYIDCPEAAAYPVVRSFFEVSCLSAVPGGGVISIAVFLPLAAAMLSFGGLCVHLQIFSVCGGISPVKALVMRIPMAALSFVICSSFTPFFVRAGSVTVSAHISENEIAVGNNSPILSIILLIMTILIISQKSYSQNRKNVL